MSNTNNTLSSAKDMKGLRFLQPFRDRQRFSFSGCSNTNKAKPLCDIPASIAFVIPQKQPVRENPRNPSFPQ